MRQDGSLVAGQKRQDTGTRTPAQHSPPREPCHPGPLLPLLGAARRSHLLWWPSLPRGLHKPRGPAGTQAQSSSCQVCAQMR